MAFNRLLGDAQAFITFRFLRFCLAAMSAGVSLFAAKRNFGFMIRQHTFLLHFLPPYDCTYLVTFGIF